ncbi:hypothetical protein [Anatilimnocola floriformis]|uniref:hypothetical protein n=1 Tax=Anatilimnocola floriformis TaxID=2948575 RepID=UPI0020C5B1D3|nr:hypothetical protein [Anatilimnocola floriformis]
MFRTILALFVFFFVTAPLFAEEAPEKPLTVEEALAKAGSDVYVELTIQSAKNLLADRGAVYLDSEKNFRDPKNIAITITKAAAADLKKTGIEDPAEHFKGKTVRVRGKLNLKDKIARLEVKEAKQIELVK